MLEAKYFSDIPDVNRKLRESGILSRLDRPKNDAKLSRENINNNIAKRNVEKRIHNFCIELERYKDTKVGIRIPKEVQENAEKIRHENAVLYLRQTPSKQEQIRREVAEMLGL
jgi:ribonuclease I